MLDDEDLGYLSDIEDGDLSDFEVEGPEFQAEVKAFERVGVGSRTDIEGLSAEAKRLQRLQKQLYSDEYFKTLLEISIKKYNDILKLSNEVLNDIRNSYYKLNHANYKNTSCLLISYYCLDKNKDIDVNKLKKVKSSILSSSKDFKEEDIIRYCRLWKALK